MNIAPLLFWCDAHSDLLPWAEPFAAVYSKAAVIRNSFMVPLYRQVCLWCFIDKTKCVTQICRSSDVNNWCLEISSRQQIHWRSMCLSLSIDSHHCTDFSLHPNLGQQSLTWCLKFAYPHTPTPTTTSSIFFSFCMRELAGCHWASLCFCLLCHISSSV